MLKTIIKGFEEVSKHLSSEASAISFCFPGPAEYEAGIIGDLANLPTFRGGVALGPMLESVFEIPVFIRNDGDLFTYGEAIDGLLPEINALLEKHNSPKHFNNLFGATFGTGFGGGIVSYGDLLPGDNSASGEINRLRNKLYSQYSVEESVSIRGVKNVFIRETGISAMDCPEPRDIFHIAQGEKLGNRDAAIKAFHEMAEVAGSALADAVSLIDGLVVIGGNGSQTGSYALHQHGFPVVGIASTIDNDLYGTDHCPGFGTAAKFVAQALMGDDLDNRALPGVKIDVIMGRHAGFLTAATALGKQRDDDGPHLVYVPERPVSMDKLLADVDGVYKKLGRCVIAVSEGICDTDHKTWAEKLAENEERDAHGNIQLSGTGALADFLASQIKSNLKIKRVRADTFGYLQRSYAGLQSKVDVDEARRCGRQAVQYAMEYDSGSVAIKRIGEGAAYGAELFRTELKNVAEKTKSIPAEYINADGNGVTEAFVNYAMPLVGGLPKTEYLGTNPRI